MIALLLAPLAAAWTTEDVAWPPTASPVTVVWSGLPDGLDRAETVEALEGASAAWAAASCGKFDIRFVEQEAPLERGKDGVSALILGDPEDALDAEHPLQVYRYAGHASVAVEGEYFDNIEEADMVFDALPYAPDAAIDATCDETWSFQSLVTRALGGLAGLGPSCDSDETCAEPGVADATMYPSLPACDTGGSTPEDDDRLGIRWLYRLGFDATCLPDPVDAMATTCTLAGTRAGEARWDFGDGTSAEGATAAHTYAEPGAYVVTACVDIEECDVPSCDRMTVWAVGPGAVTGGAADGELPGGCATTPWPAGLALTLASLVAARTRTSRAR